MGKAAERREPSTISSNRGGWALFIIVALSIWGLMHAYVFWRVLSVPWVAAHFRAGQVWLFAAIFWTLFPLTRILNSRSITLPGVVLEHVVGLWVGILFLAVCSLLVVD